jgi:hypothetical protein
VENPVTEIERIRTIADPAERAAALSAMLLHDLPTLTTEASTLRQAALQEMKDAGMSLAEIAAKITDSGTPMDRSRVWQILKAKPDNYGRHAAK